MESERTHNSQEEQNCSRDADQQIPSRCIKAMAVLSSSWDSCQLTAEQLQMLKIENSMKHLSSFLRISLLRNSLHCDKQV